MNPMLFMILQVSHTSICDHRLSHRKENLFLSKVYISLGLGYMKMPKDLFRKSVVTVSNDENNNTISQNLIGYVAKDIDEVIVVFSEFNQNLRFDIPKSIISVAGNLVIIDSSETLSKYKVNREDPLPQGEGKAFKEISGKVTRAIEPELLRVETNNQSLEREESKKHYKTPVQAPMQPTTEMTETSRAQFEKKGGEGFMTAFHQRIESKGETAIGFVKTDKKANELQPPKYEAEEHVTNLEVTESIREKEKDTKFESNKVSSSSPLEETVIENKTKSHSELSQDKPITLGAVQSMPTHREQVKKVIVTLPRADREAINGQEFPGSDTGVKKEALETNMEKPGLDMKEDQPQEFPGSDTGVRFDILSGDYPSPLGLSISLWQDFAQAGIDMYDGFAREFSKINEYWVDIFWKAWSESSHRMKKNE